MPTNEEREAAGQPPHMYGGTGQGRCRTKLPKQRPLPPPEPIKQRPLPPAEPIVDPLEPQPWEPPQPIPEAPPEASEGPPSRATDTAAIWAAGLTMVGIPATAIHLYQDSGLWAWLDGNGWGQWLFFGMVLGVVWRLTIQPAISNTIADGVRKAKKEEETKQ